MPEMDGIEFVREAQNNGLISPERIIVITGKIADSVHRELAGLNVNNIVQKPFTLKEIDTVLENVLK